MLAEPREGGWADLRGPEPRPLPALSRDGAGSAHPGWARGLAGSGDRESPGQLRGGGNCLHASPEACFQLFARLEMEPESGDGFLFFFFQPQEGSPEIKNHQFT